MVADYAPSLGARRARRSHVVQRSILLGATLAVGAGFAMAGVAYGGSHNGADTVMVHRGDTVWSIAADRYPAADVANRVQEIISLNRLTAAQVQPGQTLALPGS